MDQIAMGARAAMLPQLPKSSKRTQPRHIFVRRGRCVRL
jgi:hypothetical protein